MKLLIIEDDHIIAEPLSDFLKSNNYVIDVASDGLSGFNLATNNEYDLIITDYLLPNLNGQEIIKRLRKIGNTTPILAISVCNDTSNKVSFLEKGADDYLTKPFFFTELQARIKAILRRQQIPDKKIINYQDLSLDLLNQEATRADRAIYLTTKEFLLLKLLIENPEVIFSRQAINEQAWDAADHHFSNIIEAYILKLRTKIDFKKPFLIKTVSGRGYKLDIN